MDKPTITRARISLSLGLWLGYWFGLFTSMVGQVTEAKTYTFGWRHVLVGAGLIVPSVVLGIVYGKTGGEHETR